MTGTKKRKALVGATLVALVIGGASLAWACTRLPSVSLSPSFGRAGSQTQVTGRSFSAGEPVEVRWNSTTGPVLGRTAAGPDFAFSVPVVLPSDAVDGTYYIVAVAPTSRAQAAFQVRTRTTSAAGDPAVTPEGQTSASGSGAEATGSDGGQTSASTRGGNGTVGAGEQSGELGFAAPQGQTSGEVTPAPATQTTPAPARAADATTASGSATAGSAASSSSGTPAASPTPAPATAGAPGQPVAGTDEQQEAASPRSASADLWSGFSAGNPGWLTPGLDGGAPASSGTTPLAVGVGILSAGLVALGLGFGTAEVRRKRVLASQGA